MLVGVSHSAFDVILWNLVACGADVADLVPNIKRYDNLVLAQQAAFFAQSE